MSRINLRAIGNKLENVPWISLRKTKKMKSKRHAIGSTRSQAKTRLQKTEHGSNDTHNTSSGGGNIHGVGGTRLGGLGTTGASDAGVGANTGGSSDGTVAEELAANLGARLQLLESVTTTELSRGLDVESTVNLVESRSRDAAMY